MRSAEDPIAQARRHVAEAEDHIARQEALVVRLSSDLRHAGLAAEAKEILQTLKHTLSLARQHLDLELKTNQRQDDRHPQALVRAALPVFRAW